MPVAHRGLHGAGEGLVENSLAAVEAAIEGGYAVEVDLRLTADGGLVVIQLRHVAGRGYGPWIGGQETGDVLPQFKHLGTEGAGREGTDEVVCVIDLDTVMEGSWLMDFGDLCRTAICAAPEDTRDLDEIEVDLDRFQALVEGYAEVLKGLVSQAEIDRMVYSVFLLTYELALRFFTDYLQNDRYFGAKYPEHNLVRTRSQLTLALKVTALREPMEEIVERAFSPD